MLQLRPVNGLVKGAFQASRGALSFIKSSNDVPCFIALGQFHERLFTNIADGQIVIIAGRQPASTETHLTIMANGKIEKIFARHI